MRVLITGGAGFIGSQLAEYFQGRAHVRLLDNLRTGFRRNLDGMDVEFVEGSVRDRDLVREVVQNFIRKITSRDPLILTAFDFWRSSSMFTPLI